MPWWIGGAAVVAVLSGVFWAGDNYGWSAHRYAECQAETERRNAAVAKVVTDEEARHASEEAKRAANRAAFAKRAPSIGQCILTGDMAAALNGIGE